MVDSRFAIGVLLMLPTLAGLGLSAWRFRLHDSLGGIACGMGGLALTVVLVLRLYGRGLGDSRGAD